MRLHSLLKNMSYRYTILAKGKIMIKHYQSVQFNIALIEDCTPEDRHILQEKFDINQYVFDYIDDEYELSRAELMGNEAQALFVMRFPTNDPFTAQPLTILLDHHQLFLFVFHHMDNLTQYIKNTISDYNDNSINFILKLIFHISAEYIKLCTSLSQNIKQIEQTTNRLTQHSNIENFQRIILIDRQILGIKTDILDNLRCVTDIKEAEPDDIRTLPSVDRQLLHRTHIETQQASRMVRILNERTTQLREVYDHLLANRLNNIMRFLTVWSLLFSIPNIISSFYGMNIHLPFAHFRYIWVILFLIPVIVIWIGYTYLKHNYTTK